MGTVINRKTLVPNEILRLPSPVILCSPWQLYETIIEESGFQTISLNLPLARVLFGKSEKEIIANITDIVLGLLSEHQHICLSDYEMLFDPRYKLDNLKLFCEIARYNKLFVKWSGSFMNDFLTYAEPGYIDFAKYKVSDYEITCVV